MPPENVLKIGERFTVKYDPTADPLGYFKFLARTTFEIVGVTSTGYEIKKVLDI